MGCPASPTYFPSDIFQESVLTIHIFQEFIPSKNFLSYSNDVMLFTYVAYPQYYTFKTFSGMYSEDTISNSVLITFC